MIGDDVSLLVRIGFYVKQFHRLSAESQQFPLSPHGDFGRVRFGLRIVALNTLVEIELSEHRPPRLATRRLFTLQVRQQAQAVNRQLARNLDSGRFAEGGQ